MCRRPDPLWVLGDSVLCSCESQAPGESVGLLQPWVETTAAHTRNKTCILDTEGQQKTNKPDSKLLKLSLIHQEAARKGHKHPSFFSSQVIFKHLEAPGEEKCLKQSRAS